MTAPRHLRLDVVGGDPLGRGDVPVVSWWLPDGAAVQHGHRLRTDDGHDTGLVPSQAQAYVAVPGPATPRRSTDVRVQVATDLGESDWSDPLPFTVDLREEDWTAPWVGADEGDVPPPGQRPAVWLRTVVDVGPHDEARLHVTSLGLHEAFLDGSRVGDAELAPGYTQYRDRVPSQAVDVTGPLHPGRHVLAVLLSDGWYRGQVGLPRAADQFGDRTALRLQLEVRHGQDWSVAARTDESWRSGPSHVLAADLIAGQHEDRRLVDPALHDPSYDDGGWTPVVLREVTTTVVAPVAPPVRRTQVLPASLTRLPDGAAVVDLGQNVNGWLRVSDLGPAGTRTTLRHGEHLDAAGDLTTTHLDVDLPILPEPLPLGQVDEVVSAGVEGDVFEPRATTHGFRYVRVEGNPGLRAEDVHGVVVHSDLRRTGWFGCSDERLNRLHDAAVWSLRGNVCGVPTDCPQRERAGWTGDWQVFATTAAFLYDVLGFTRSWLRDVALDQRADGCVPNVSPCPPAEGFDGPLGGLTGSAGWGDVVVSAPWDLHEAYGDASLLREAWGPARAWVDLAAARAASGRHPARAAARPEEAPHERHLWDTGFHWGEWMEPGVEITDFGAFVAADESEVATAYLSRSARRLARIAGLLGEPGAVVARYDALADGARLAWQREFLGEDGTLRVRTQAAHVRALAFDLVPEGARAGVADDLVALVEAADHHVGTGFLSTGLLLPTLADAGHADTAYRLLLQDTEPSWLTMLERGATTVWERWDGVDADGVAHDSLNHASKGAVVSFLHRHVGGLVPTAPGYRSFRVRPTPGGGLTSAGLRHDTPFGPVVVDWRCEGDVLLLDVEVPGGTTAEVVLPDGASSTVGPGVHHWAAVSTP